MELTALIDAWKAGGFGLIICIMAYLSLHKITPAAVDYLKAKAAAFQALHDAIGKIMQWSELATMRFDYILHELDKNTDSLNDLRRINGLPVRKKTKDDTP